MTSFEPNTRGQRVWITPTVVAIAIVALVATTASFVWSMRANMGMATAQSEYVEPDPHLLNDFVAPEGFTAVRDVPDCLATRTSRCYLTELPRAQMMAAAAQWVDTTESPEQESYMGHPAYSWCSEVLGAPANFSVTSNLINAKQLEPGKWRIPDEPQFDDQWVLAVVLAESATCD